MEFVFDSSIILINSLSELSNTDHSNDDLLSLCHDPDKLFCYRRSLTPTMTQTMREEALAKTDWRATLKAFLSLLEPFSGTPL